MSDIRMVDMLLLDELFEMQSGYVLDFTDRTMSLFFAEMNVDIGDREYCRDGMSKAKRLRCFLRTVDNKSAAATLKSLWEYRTEYRLRTQQPESVDNARGRLLSLISRLEGGAHPGVVGSAPAPAFDGVRLRQLSKQFLDLAALAPQQRGYGFETFLGALFGAYGLKPREPFRLRGEQIDGSFQLQGETYLLEAKWESKPTGAADLFVFDAGALRQLRRFHRSRSRGVRPCQTPRVHGWP
jgi:hypothetical protein